MRHSTVNPTTVYPTTVYPATVRTLRQFTPRVATVYPTTVYPVFPYYKLPRNLVFRFSVTKSDTTRDVQWGFRVHTVIYINKFHFYINLILIFHLIISFNDLISFNNLILIYSLYICYLIYIFLARLVSPLLQVF